MLSSLDQEHDGHLVAKVDEGATFRHSVPFFFFFLNFIHSANAYWALLHANFKAECFVSF